MGVHEAVEAAWARAVERWDDPSRHEALLGLVAQHSAFAWAAGKYKERAGDAIAERQLERLRKSATATMLATASRKPAPKDGPYKRTILLVALLLVMIVLGLVYMKVLAVDHQRRSRAPAKAGPAKLLPAKRLPGKPATTPVPRQPAAH